MLTANKIGMSTAVGWVLLISSLGFSDEIPTSLEIVDTDMRLSDWSVINKHSSVTLFDSSFTNTEAIRGVAFGQFWSAIYRNDPVWDPSELGTMERIQLTADFVTPNRAVLFAPVFVQGASVYAPPGVFPYYDDPDSFGVPQGLSWDIELFRYGKELGPGPGQLDFSETAAPIHLGLAARRDSGGTSFLFGNVRFNASGSRAVPEPSGAIVMGLFLTVLGRFRRRKS